jgi:hypothetical protein
MFIYRLIKIHFLLLPFLLHMCIRLYTSIEEVCGELSVTKKGCQECTAFCIISMVKLVEKGALIAVN